MSLNSRCDNLWYILNWLVKFWDTIFLPVEIPCEILEKSALMKYKNSYRQSNLPNLRSAIPLCWNQSVDLHNKTVDWFLFGGNINLKQDEKRSSQQCSCLFVFFNAIYLHSGLFLRNAGLGPLATLQCER